MKSDRVAPLFPRTMMNISKNKKMLQDLKIKKNLDKNKKGDYQDANLVSSSGYSSAATDNGDQNLVFFRILNQVWYYVFFLGTQLGDETYYSIFFCFWFWNIDLVVGRKVILIWNLVMYIGQGMKDIIRWPRPAMPPAIQLEAKWSLEYGMPSTHAMVGLAVPVSILYTTIGRYQYPFYAWAIVAIVWCTLVCTSRLYLGVHSYADIYVGLVFGAMLLAPILYIINDLDAFLVKHPLAPVFSIVMTLAAVIFYPGSDRWTPARGDTTVILGSNLGVQLGVWTLFYFGHLKGPASLPPYPILWPTYAQYGQTILRLIVGGVIFLAARAVVKPLSLLVACYLMNEDLTRLNKQKNDIRNKNKIKAELTYKFSTYVAVGFSAIVITPIVFRVMGIERSTYYTEL